VLPSNAERQLHDPFADDNTARNRLIVLIVLALLVAVLWVAGLLDSVLPGTMKKNRVAPQPPVSMKAPAVPAQK
jgi:hypothetical protein